MKKSIYLAAVLSAMLAGLFSCSYPNEVKLMSYNVRNGRGVDDERKPGRIAEVIRSQAPEVVAIQEVDSMTGRSGNTFVLGELAEMTGMIPVFAPAIDYDGGKYGIGLLTREEPLSVTRIALPGREEERMMVVAEFKDYYFGCTHLSLTAEDALESARIINRLVGGYDKPMILAGDFNSYPDSPVIEELEKRFRILSDKTEFTFPADTPTETLDYIMIYDPTEKIMKVGDSKVVGDSVASDHRPIVTTVRIG